MIGIVMNRPQSCSSQDRPAFRKPLSGRVARTQGEVDPGQARVLGLHLLRAIRRLAFRDDVNDGREPLSQLRGRHLLGRVEDVQRFVQPCRRLLQGSRGLGPIGKRLGSAIDALSDLEAEGLADAGRPGVVPNRGLRQLRQSHEWAGQGGHDRKADVARLLSQGRQGQPAFSGACFSRGRRLRI